eukprot:5697691-Amphidinium_carterae.1
MSKMVICGQTTFLPHVLHERLADAHLYRRCCGGGSTPPQTLNTLSGLLLERSALLTSQGKTFKLKEAPKRPTRHSRYTGQTQ